MRSAAGGDDKDVDSSGGEEDEMPLPAPLSPESRARARALAARRDAARERIASFVAREAPSLIRASFGAEAAREAASGKKAQGLLARVAGARLVTLGPLSLGLTRRKQLNGKPDRAARFTLVHQCTGADADSGRILREVVAGTELGSEAHGDGPARRALSERIGSRTFEQALVSRLSADDFRARSELHALIRSRIVDLRPALCLSPRAALSLAACALDLADFCQDVLDAVDRTVGARADKRALLVSAADGCLVAACAHLHCARLAHVEEMSAEDLVMLVSRMLWRTRILMDRTGTAFTETGAAAANLSKILEEVEVELVDEDRVRHRMNFRKWRAEDYLLSAWFAFATTQWQTFCISKLGEKPSFAGAPWFPNFPNHTAMAMLTGSLGRGTAGAGPFAPSPFEQPPPWFVVQLINIDLRDSVGRSSDAIDALLTEACSLVANGRAPEWPAGPIQLDRLELFEPPLCGYRLRIAQTCAELAGHVLDMGALRALEADGGLKGEFGCALCDHVASAVLGPVREFPAVQPVLAAVAIVSTLCARLWWLNVSRTQPHAGLPLPSREHASLPAPVERSWAVAVWGLTGVLPADVCVFPSFIRTFVRPSAGRFDEVASGWPRSASMSRELVAANLERAAEKLEQCILGAWSPFGDVPAHKTARMHAQALIASGLLALAIQRFQAPVFRSSDMFSSLTTFGERPGRLHSTARIQLQMWSTSWLCTTPEQQHDIEGRVRDLLSSAPAQ